MADHGMMRLGKHAPRFDTRTLKMAKYLGADILPQVPASVAWSAKLTSPGMMLNDQLGDCTCATAGHMIQIWTANNGSEVTLDDNSILQAYKDVSGYNGDPLTDQGANELNVLNYWRQTGIGTHKIDAYAVLDPKDLDHLKAAIWLFGGVYCGVALPLSAQRQDIWQVSLGGTDGDYSPGSWGGHAIPVVDFDDHGLTCITWGATKRLTWDWWKVYADEAYALVSRDWVNSRPAPSGFDLTTLMTDLQGVSM